jgi:hypothetical protein
MVSLRASLAKVWTERGSGEGAVPLQRNDERLKEDDQGIMEELPAKKSKGGKKGTYEEEEEEGLSRR